VVQDEIAKQMKALTEKQGEGIEQVEKKARDADVEVLVGVDEQKTASKYACSARWCKIIIIIIILACILVLALGLGLGLGLKKKKN
jgi:t-SNARE complex subunit (syntaxin)